MMEPFPREYIQGSLDLLVLSVLSDGPKYGYLIQKTVRQATHDGVALQAGTLYPLLHRLEAEKMIKAKWDDSTSRQRKWYELTAAGRKHLTKQAQDWVRMADCMRAWFVSSLGIEMG